MMQLLSLLFLLPLAVDARRLGASRQLQNSTTAYTSAEVAAAVNQILFPPAVTIGSSSNGPLGLCEGNCESDQDCQGTLICSTAAPVPGCTGGGPGGVCTFPSLDFLGFAPQLDETVTLPLGICQGDCDNDRQCGPGLICWQRPTRQANLPGCVGIEAFTAEYGRPTDFCVSEIYRGTYAAFGIETPGPTVVPPPTAIVEEVTSNTPSPTVPLAMLEMVGNDWLPQGAFPLGPCQADCDGDDDCQTGLQCYQRAGTEDMSPWCRGQAVPGEDYCIPVAAAANQPLKLPLNVVGNDGMPQGAFPLKLCQGDCDNDVQCQDGLVCMLRTNANLTNFCLGEVGPADYCVPDPAAVVVETPKPETVKPVANSTAAPVLGDDDLVETDTGVEDDDAVFVATERKGILP